MDLRGARGRREPDSGSTRWTNLKGMFSSLGRLFMPEEGVDIARRVGHWHVSNDLGEVEVASEDGRDCRW